MTALVVLSMPDSTERGKRDHSGKKHTALQSQLPPQSGSRLPSFSKLLSLCLQLEVAGVLWVL